MTELLNLLNKEVLITDGAFGTYYNEITQSPTRCERANLEAPETVEKIHRAYIEAGAGLIRTNTFAANTVALSCDMDYVKSIIHSAYKIALKAADNKVIVGADIGPVPTDDLNEYLAIADIWLELGADTFILETFTMPQTPLKVAEYIKTKAPGSHVHLSYALTDTGYTKNAYHCKRLAELSEASPFVDTMGFNCGVGPMHLQNILKSMGGAFKKPLFAMPNAGYPEMINGKVCYTLNPEYFAEILAECVSYGVSALGGCCGTKPEHIALIRKSLGRVDSPRTVVSDTSKKQDAKEIKESTLMAKLNKGEFVVAVELDPPFKPEFKKLIEGARLLKNMGVDIITLADSPMGKSRVDSVIASLKLKREVGVEVLPHICCRDKNAVSLRSVLLGAYMEGIRNVLVVTGDPVPGEYKEDIKSVFNMSSMGLMDMISQMNGDVFGEGNIAIGGAVNFNAKNKEAELKRLIKKQEKGAGFFLTQPIFTQEAIDFIKALPKDRDYKILAGVMPPVSYKNVMFLNNELAGVTIPSHIVDKFSPDMTREEAQAVGEAIAVDLINSLKPYVDGIYLIAPFNRCQMIGDILKKTGLGK